MDLVLARRVEQERRFEAGRAQDDAQAVGLLGGALASDAARGRIVGVAVRDDVARSARVRSDPTIDAVGIGHDDALATAQPDARIADTR